MLISETYTVTHVNYFSRLEKKRSSLGVYLPLDSQWPNSEPRDWRDAHTRDKYTLHVHLFTEPL